MQLWGSELWSTQIASRARVEGEKNVPKKLEAGQPALGVEEFRKPTARWTLNRV